LIDWYSELGDRRSRLAKSRDALRKWKHRQRKHGRVLSFDDARGLLDRIKYVRRSSSS